MYKHKKILAFIGARGGSKGLKDKNILDLAGKPLIAWTIEAALGSKYIDRAIVSTDSRQIAEIAKASGADVPFLRPAALAKDDSPAQDAIRHCLAWLTKHKDISYDLILMLQPTSPRRTAKHIDDAIEFYFKRQRTGKDTLVSVVKAAAKCGWLMKKNTKGYISFTQPQAKKGKGSRQELPEYYIPNGAIYLAPVRILRTGYFYGPRTLAFEMEEGASIDIDTRADLEQCLSGQKSPAFRQRLVIGGKEISADSPTFVIAEAGVNHNGDIQLAKKLVDVALEAGADAVKFQSFKAKELILEDVGKPQYQRRTTDAKESQFDMLKKLEVTREQMLEIKEYCDRKGIIFLTTPFDERSLDELDDFDLEAYKISSTDITNLMFIKRVAKKRKPIILSTGMAYMNEVAEALKTIAAVHRDVILLQCVANYPIRDEEAHLNVMRTYRDRFNVLVGYSDHTVGVGASPYAVSLGAKVIEKHITLDKKQYGPDNKASLEPQELKEFIREIRRAEKFLGSADKSPTASEEETRKALQKCLVAARDIPAGESFSEENIIAKRTGGRGISAFRYMQILNKKATRSFQKNEIIEV